MAEERVQRRLAAILAADVVGYTRLMEQDETGTLARLKSLRSEVFDPRTKQFDGRIFKNTGDGALAEFGSAVDAVQCAVEIQRALAQRNADLPEAARIILRIGISLGDVIVEGDDLYGNGVNVAARMEGLAEPGGICVSGNVHEHIGNALDVTFEDLGEQAVKNIDRPVRSYRVHLEPVPASAIVLQPDRPPALPDKPSIAVLPFANISGDPEQEYFADGMTEDLITDLSQISGLFVIARNSSFAFKGQSADIKDVGDKLGVKYVLEGSVRKAANKVRINAQLIDVASGGHLWAKRYDRDFDDIFALQDEITEQIVTALEVTLTSADVARTGQKRTTSVEAYELFLRGRASYFQYTPDSLTAARGYFERAIEIDPRFADAHGYLSYCYLTAWTFLWPDIEEGLDRAVASAERAVSLDPNSAIAHNRLGWVKGFIGEFDQAVPSFERALMLEPDNAEVHAYYGCIRNYMGEGTRGLELITAAFRLEPMTPPSWDFVMGQSYFDLRRFDEAVTRLRRAVDRAPAFPPARLFLACTYVESGHIADAREQIRALLEVAPRHTLDEVLRIYPYQGPCLDRFLDGLRKAGLPE